MDEGKAGIGCDLAANAEPSLRWWTHNSVISFVNSTGLISRTNLRLFANQRGEGQVFSATIIDQSVSLVGPPCSPTEGLGAIECTRNRLSPTRVAVPS